MSELEQRIKKLFNKYPDIASDDILGQTEDIIKAQQEAKQALLEIGENPSTSQEIRDLAFLNYKIAEAQQKQSLLLQKNQGSERICKFINAKTCRYFRCFQKYCLYVGKRKTKN